MTKNKSKQVKKAKYLLLLPLLTSMLIYTSCNVEGSTKEKDIEIENLKQTIKDLKEANDVKEKLGSYLLKKADSLTKVLNSKNDVPFAVVENVPVFPGCKGTRKEKSDCLNNGIRKFVAKKFNYNLVKSLDISKGKKKIWTQFRIDEKGNVVDVNVIKSPHQKLSEEALRVIKTLPKMKPGLQRGKPVGMKYTLPITFNVE